MSTGSVPTPDVISGHCAVPGIDRQARRRRLVRQGAVVAFAASTAVMFGAGPASADTFVPSNTAPTVTSPGLTMPGTTNFEPDAAASDEVYAYSVTVGDAESLNDITTVNVCLYHSKKEDGVTTGEGDSTCTTLNPQNTVKLTWTRLTNTFSISSGSSAHWALGTGADASVAPTSLVDTSGTVTFKFRVSEAMREGTWTAKVTATDISGSTATDSSVTKPVNPYSAITTRTGQNFGTFGTGTGVERTDAPTVTSNGTTSLSLTAGNFTNGSYSYTLKTDGATSVAPASGQATLDCMIGGTFVEGSAVRIGTGATALTGNATATGTAEGGTAVSNICRLKHGGGRPSGTYTATVVNSISNI